MRGWRVPLKPSRAKEERMAGPERFYAASQTAQKIMKTKQLANVLIKILGLSLCTQSVMHFVNGIVNIFATSRMFSWMNLLSGALLLVGGVCLIVKSQCVADLLFKNEEE
jgi:hypothetical protein